MTDANNALQQTQTVQLGYQCVCKVLDLCRYEELLALFRSPPGQVDQNDDVFFVFDGDEQPRDTRETREIREIRSPRGPRSPNVQRGGRCSETSHTNSQNQQN